MSTGERRPKDYSQVGVQNFRNINNDDIGLFHMLSLHMTSRYHMFYEIVPGGELSSLDARCIFLKLINEVHQCMHTVYKFPHK